MPSLQFSDILSLLAFLISLSALGWNIIRDLVKDRMSLDIRISVGDKIPFAGMPEKGFFRDADSEYKPRNPKVAFTITNAGRHPIVISKIHGRYRNPKAGTNHPMWVFAAPELPKTLQPYEFIMEIADDAGLIKAIQDGNVKNIYVEDTKGKKWTPSRKALKRLERTAQLVAS